LRPGDDRTHLLSGWSEKLLDMIRDLEGGQTPEGNAEPVEVPAVEILRGCYQW